MRPSDRLGEMGGIAVDPGRLPARPRSAAIVGPGAPQRAARDSPAASRRMRPDRSRSGAGSSNQRSGQARGARWRPTRSPRHRSSAPRTPGGSRERRRAAGRPCRRQARRRRACRSRRRTAPSRARCSAPRSARHPPSDAPSSGPGARAQGISRSASATSWPAVSCSAEARCAPQQLLRIGDAASGRPGLRGVAGSASRSATG